MKRSLHILADFYGCRSNPGYFTNASQVRRKTLAVIRRAGFDVVASRFYKFPAGGGGEGRRRAGGASANQGGITGVIIVAESHLTIHTWPERRFVNLDVFFCSYTRDNSRKARAVFSKFRKIYKPARVRRREVWRD